MSWVTARHLLPHASVALDNHLEAKPGERIVLAWDETVAGVLVEAFRAAAETKGLDTTLVTYAPVAYRPIHQYGLFAGRSLGPPLPFPPVLLAALQSADAFVLLGSDTELLFSPDLPSVVSGRRGIWLPYLTAANAHRLLFTSPTEVAEHAELIKAVGTAVAGEHEVHVTSAEGTDLHLRLGQHRVLQRTGTVGPGELLMLPAGSVARVPDEGSANGRLVIDRTVCADDYKALAEPITLIVADGRVVQVEGGAEATALRRFLEGLGDERAYHLTELGIGTNPRCRRSGVGAPAEDTHVQGTVAFALGADVHVGGVTRGPCHVDMTMRFPSLAIDGRQLVRDGHLEAAS